MSGKPKMSVIPRFFPQTTSLSKSNWNPNYQFYGSKSATIYPSVKRHRRCASTGSSVYLGNTNEKKKIVLEKKMNRMTKNEFQRNIQEGLNLTLTRKDVYRDLKQSSFSSSFYVAASSKFPRELNYLNTIISVDTYSEIIFKHKLHFHELKMFQNDTHERRSQNKNDEDIHDKLKVGDLVERSLYTKVDTFSPYMLVSLLRGLHKYELFTLTAIPAIQRLSRKAIAIVDESSVFPSSSSSDTHSTLSQTNNIKTGVYEGEKIDQVYVADTSQVMTVEKIKRMEDHDNAVIMEILVNNIVLASITKIDTFSAQDISDLLNTIREMNYWPDERSLYIIDRAIHRKFQLDPNSIGAQICLSILHNLASLKYIPTVGFKTDFSSRIVIPTLRSLQRAKLSYDILSDDQVEITDDENLKLMIASGALEFKDISKQLRREWLELIRIQFLKTELLFPVPPIHPIQLRYRISVEGFQEDALSDDKKQNNSMSNFKKEKRAIAYLESAYSLSQFSVSVYVLHRFFDSFNPSLTYIEEMKEYSDRYLDHFSLKDLYFLSIAFLGFNERKGFLQTVPRPSESLSNEYLSEGVESHLPDLPKIHHSLLDTFVSKFQKEFISQHGHAKDTGEKETYRTYFERKLLAEAKEFHSVLESIKKEKDRLEFLRLSKERKCNLHLSSRDFRLLENKFQDEGLEKYQVLLKYIAMNQKATFPSRELIELLRSMTMVNYLPSKGFLDMLTIVLGRVLFVEEPLSHLLARHVSPEISGMLPSINLRSQLALDDYLFRKSIDLISDVNKQELTSFITIMEDRLTLLSKQRIQKFDPRKINHHNTDQKVLIQSNHSVDGISTSDVTDKTFDDSTDSYLSKTLHYHDFLWLANRETVLSDVLRCTVPQEISNCIISLGKLNYSPKRIDLFMEKLMSIVDRQLFDYNMSQLINILYGLSLMQYIPLRNDTESRFGCRAHLRAWKHFQKSYMAYVLSNPGNFVYEVKKGKKVLNSERQRQIDAYRSNLKDGNTFFEQISPQRQGEDESLSIVDFIYDTNGLPLQMLEKAIMSVESLFIRHDFLSKYYNQNKTQRNRFRGNHHRMLKLEKESKYNRIMNNPNCARIRFSEMHIHEYESTYEKPFYQNLEHGILFDKLLSREVTTSSDPTFTTMKSSSDRVTMLNFNELQTLECLLSHKWIEKQSILKMSSSSSSFPSSLAQREILQKIHSLLPMLQERCKDKGIQSITMKHVSIPPFADIPLFETQFNFETCLNHRKFFQSKARKSIYSNIEKNINSKDQNNPELDYLEENSMSSTLPIVLDIEERENIYTNDAYNEHIAKSETNLRRKWLEYHSEDKWFIMKIPYYAWNRCKNDNHRVNFLYKQLSKLHLISQKEYKPKS